MLTLRDAIAAASPLAKAQFHDPFKAHQNCGARHRARRPHPRLPADQLS
jgi:hypothetical protein